MECYFDEEKHEYYVDGEKVPSVTEICSPVSAQRLNAIDQNILMRASQRGTACHEVFEEYALVGEIDFDEISPEIVPYIEQFILWWRTYRPRVKYAEKCLFCKEFAGTCDIIAEIDGKTLLIDYKTTSQIDKKSLSVQLEGYYRLCKLHNIKIDECWYLHIKKDGWVFKSIKLDPDWFDILLKHYNKMKEKYNG